MQVAKVPGQRRLRVALQDPPDAAGVRRLLVGETTWRSGGAPPPRMPSSCASIRAGPAGGRPPRAAKSARRSRGTSSCSRAGSARGRAARGTGRARRRRASAHGAAGSRRSLQRAVQARGRARPRRRRPARCSRSSARGSRPDARRTSRPARCAAAPSARRAATRTAPTPCDRAARAVGRRLRGVRRPRTVGRVAPRVRERVRREEGPRRAVVDPVRRQQPDHGVERLQRTVRPEIEGVLRARDDLGHRRHPVAVLGRKSTQCVPLYCAQCMRPTPKRSTTGDRVQTESNCQPRREQRQLRAGGSTSSSAASGPPGARSSSCRRAARARPPRRGTSSRPCDRERPHRTW